MDKLKIIVCIKQVPAQTDVMMDQEKGTLIREGVLSEVNPFDMYAIEEAIRLKEKYGGEVDVISMGPPQADAALREAIAMGCNNAILLTDKKFAGADTWATAYTLASGIKKIGSYDIIMCGLKTTDGDTGQVGPSLAEELGIPFIGYVRKIIDLKERSISLERVLDDYYEIVESKLPVVVTVTKEANEPRYPSFKRQKMAKETPISTWNLKDLGGKEKRYGTEGSPTEVVKIFPPPARGKGEIIKGKPEYQAKILIEKLKEKKIL